MSYEEGLVCLKQTCVLSVCGLSATHCTATGWFSRPSSRRPSPLLLASQGTSVPISIPSWRVKNRDASLENGAGPQDSEPQYPATFVPPHQLSVKNDWAFSFTGDSPAGALKRERLRSRNAILKSTGFLEPECKNLNTIGLQERNRLVVGGLSQALHGAAATQS
jgi:Senescence regulator